FYQQKDAALLNLERGMMAYFAGLNQKSIDYFLKAEARMDELVTRSASRAAASVVGNDNQLDYDGDDHEQLYVNAFTSLNFVKLGQVESATIEIRKMTFKLDELTRRYGNPLEPIEGLKYANTINWDDPALKERLGKPKAQIRNSAWSRYLATILYAKNNQPDDSRIEAELLPDAFAVQQNLAWGDFPTAEDLPRLQEAGAYNVLLVAYAGQSPQKYAVEYRDF
ncbi:hypothetical protein RZS08_09405, partial [Arthrospira platensis SPKY1]|nr:hypothetical protein [Arthrospira platensis SPKY1]